MTTKLVKISNYYYVEIPDSIPEDKQKSWLYDNEQDWAKFSNRVDGGIDISKDTQRFTL